MSNNINKVTVIGTGVIGAGWIIRCLAHNKKVVAFDKDLKLKKSNLKVKNQCRSKVFYQVIKSIVVIS